MRAGIFDYLVHRHCLSSTRTMPDTQQVNNKCLLNDSMSPLRYFVQQLTVYMHSVLRKSFKAVKCNQ